MAQIKLTKNELRVQQTKLSQLTRYLPTLQLKKAMLQVVVQEARQELIQVEEDLSGLLAHIEPQAPSLTYPGIDFKKGATVTAIHRRYENIAGVDVPLFTGVSFEDYPYHLFDSPVFTDILLESLQKIASKQGAVIVAKEKRALSKRSFAKYPSASTSLKRS